MQLSSQRRAPQQAETLIYFLLKKQQVAIVRQLDFRPAHQEESTLFATTSSKT